MKVNEIITKQIILDPFSPHYHSEIISGFQLIKKISDIKHNCTIDKCHKWLKFFFILNVSDIIIQQFKWKVWKTNWLNNNLVRINLKKFNFQKKSIRYFHIISAKHTYM